MLSSTKLVIAIYFNRAEISGSRGVEVVRCRNGYFSELKTKKIVSPLAMDVMRTVFCTLVCMCTQKQEVLCQKWPLQSFQTKFVRLCTWWNALNNTNKCSLLYYSFKFIQHLYIDSTCFYEFFLAFYYFFSGILIFDNKTNTRYVSMTE